MYGQLNSSTLMGHRRKLRFVACLLLSLLAGCTGQPESRIVYVTATPASFRSTEVAPPTAGAVDDLITPPTATLPLQTLVASSGDTQTHTVAAGETLFAIAQRYNTTIDRIVELNALINPDIITVGQVLTVPAGGQLVTPNLILLPDQRFVRGPGSEFDVAAFVRQQPGLLSRALEPVTHRRANGDSEIRFLTGAEVIELVSRETSIDARVLLAMLEYRAGWLSNAAPANVEWPLISQDASLGIDRKGLYKQVSWAANELNRGYYGWKYGAWSAMEFVDGPRLTFDRSLNAGTVALYHMLHLDRAPGDWLRDISAEGWAAVYGRYFGDQLGVAAPVVLAPPPEMALPYARGETWLFTGGHHGGWGSGSAWAALDFAPPDERPSVTACYTSRFPARAVADGRIARSNDGVVVLDLDGDGDERTGWTVLYLHLDSSTTVPAGQSVSTGEVIGRPSCEGGFSTATHLHIARRYEGEWIPADCASCGGNGIYDFVMAGWRSAGIVGQEYQGELRRGSDVRVAEQAANNPINQVRHD